jgi:hypothetical protein
MTRPWYCAEARTPKRPRTAHRKENRGGVSPVLMLMIPTREFEEAWQGRIIVN